MLLSNENAISSGGYQIQNSLRFQSASSQYLSRTPASAGNRQTWTLSMWIKRGALSNGTRQGIFNAYLDASNYLRIVFDTNDTLFFNDVQSGADVFMLATTQVFRDPSAFYHLVFVSDTTQATSSNRVKLYVNGTQVTTFSSTTYPSQNANGMMNTTNPHYDGRFYNAASSSFLYLDGYMAEVNFIDGQALTPSSFGTTDPTSGQWVAAKYTGTYGTNGFYLPFSNGTSTTTLGADSSGNGNNWTLTNFTRSAGVSDCWMTDVPSGNSSVGGNYCVLNAVNSSATLSQANLKSVEGASVSRISIGTIGMTTGKWYWEVTAGSTGLELGVGTSQLAVSAGNLHATGYGWGYNSDGNIYPGAVAGNATYTTNDVIGLAFNADTGVLSFYKNNTLQPTTVTGLTNGPYFPASGNGTGATNLYNFGQRSFAYTPPSGFKALCTANLPVATIKQGNKYMDATTYTGTGSTLSITNAASFKPDFVWIKSRSNAYTNALYDSIRGAGKLLQSQTTNAETGNAGDLLGAFNSNGFSVNTTYSGGSDNSTDGNGSTYVGWQWQAGQGSTSSNTNGSITSTVSVNATAGFSVVTYTGNAVNGATVGHGLGVAPKMIIVKRRDSGVDDWCVYHASIGNTGRVRLNTTAATQTNILFWNNTSPTSSVFTVGTDSGVNVNTSTYVAYCFAEIAGFSKLGSYTGNGSADGPFVYLGFRPKFIITKNASVADSWMILDSTRSTYNTASNNLRAESSAAEQSNFYPYDMLSNGFKLRSADSNVNTSGNTYIYMAFAENPFAQANAR